MIDVRVYGSGLDEHRFYYAEALWGGADQPLTLEVGWEDNGNVDSLRLVLDDPDAVGALADALRRIERRMREAKGER